MTYSIEAFDTELNKMNIYIYRNYEHYLKVTMGLEEYYKEKRKDSPILSREMGLDPQVRELINHVREKNEQNEEYHRKVQERKNKYPHLFKDSH